MELQEYHLFIKIAGQSFTTLLPDGNLGSRCLSDSISSKPRLKSFKFEVLNYTIPIANLDLIRLLKEEAEKRIETSVEYDIREFIPLEHLYLHLQYLVGVDQWIQAPLSTKHRIKKLELDI